MQRSSQSVAPDNIYLRDTWFNKDLEEDPRETPIYDPSVAPENNNKTPHHCSLNHMHKKSRSTREHLTLNRINIQILREFETHQNQRNFVPLKNRLTRPTECHTAREIREKRDKKPKYARYGINWSNDTYQVGLKTQTKIWFIC